MFETTLPRGPSLTRDADDDFIIYLARENNADLIVSGDGDLLDWPEQHPPVVRPAEFEALEPELSPHSTPGDLPDSSASLVLSRFLSRFRLRPFPYREYMDLCVLEEVQVC